MELGALVRRRATQHQRRLDADHPPEILLRGASGRAPSSYGVATELRVMMPGEIARLALGLSTAFFARANVEHGVQPILIWYDTCSGWFCEGQ